MSKFIRDTRPEDLMLMFAILICLMLFALGAFLLAKKKRDKEDENEPVYFKVAKVVEKQQLDPGTLLSISEMWILFQTEDGERVRLRTKASNSIIVGDNGYLTWQGRKLLSFERTDALSVNQE